MALRRRAARPFRANQTIWAVFQAVEARKSANLVRL
jgi:hypothetical protein